MHATESDRTFHDDPDDENHPGIPREKSLIKVDRPNPAEAFGRPERAWPSHEPEAFGRGEPAQDRHAPPKDPKRRGDDDRPPKRGDHPDDREASPEKAKDDKPADDAKPPKDDAPQKPPFYKRPVPMIILAAVLLLLTGGGVAWWLHSRHFEKTDDAFIDGHVVPMSPKVAAIVRSVRVDDNAQVQPGDVLVELDPRDFEVALQQARAGEAAARGRLAQAETQVTATRASVGEAEANITVARTNADNAQRDYDRIAALDERARSKQQLDNALANQRSTAAQVKQTEARLRAAQAKVADAEQAIETARADAARALADVRQAEINLEYCTLRAPEAGRVTKKSVEPGQYVQVGQPLFSIVQTDVWVTANFKETQLDLMRPGQPVDLEVDAYPHQDFHGKVDSVQSGTGTRFSLLPAENATGNYVKVVQRVPVKIVFDPPDQTHDRDRVLAPGMSVVPRVRVR